jgi:hypothetical protein
MRYSSGGQFAEAVAAVRAGNRPPPPSGGPVANSLAAGTFSARPKPDPALQTRIALTVANAYLSGCGFHHKYLRARVSLSSPRRRGPLTRCLARLC